MPRLGALRSLAVGVAFACAVVVVAVTDAWAHGALKSSVPAAGAHLDRIPREIRLTFNEAAERAFTRIVLLDGAGRAIALGPLTIAADSSTVAFASIAGAIGAGAHTVQWQMAGPDGHPVRGSFTFTIVPGALTDTNAAQPDTMPHHPAAAIPDNPDPAAFDAESPLYAFVRWLTFAATLLVIGGVAFRYAVLGRMNRSARAAAVALVGLADRRAASVSAIAATVLIPVAILRLSAQSVAMHGASSALDPAALWSMLTATLWGQAWLLQVVAAIGALAGFLIARRGQQAGWGVAALSAIVLALSLSLGGHAPATPRWSAIAVASDLLHVIGAAGWLGSLVLLLAAGVAVASQLPAEQRHAAVADLVNSFSPTALAFAALAALTGALSAALHLPTVSALWSSDYGQTLLVKLGVLSLVVGAGAYNWLRVRPALGDEKASALIRRSATTEIAIAAVVLAVTAVLVATPPPRG